MKLLYSTGALGLCAFLVACNSGPPIQGCRPPTPFFNVQSGLCQSDPISGTGGTAGNGGTAGTGGGGVGDGACTNPQDAMTYMDLTYAGEMGSDAASGIASDCVFGQFDEPDIGETGCAAQAGVVLVCSANCDGPIADLAACVVDCTQAVIEDKTGMPLTEDCGACYGDSVACSAGNCAAECGANPDAPGCIDCRCGPAACTPDFEVCSGLTSTACD